MPGNPSDIDQPELGEKPLPPVRTIPTPFVLRESAHWSLLITSSVIMILAVLMSTKGEEQVMIPVFNRPLPPLCSTKRFLNLDCPGCGLTRCFISLAHGDVAQAWHYNPAGLWFFGVIAVQIPYRAYQIWRIRSGREPLRLNRMNWAFWVLLALLLGQWMVKLVMSAL